MRRLIYVETTWAACVSEELCRWKKKLDKSIKRVRGRLAILMLTVRVVDLEYS